MGWYLFVSDIRTDLSKDEILGEIIFYFKIFHKLK